MNIKTDNQSLELAIRVMAGRALECKDRGDEAFSWVYQTCTSILAEALDGNLDVLLGYAGDLELPDVPDNACAVCTSADGCKFAGVDAECECARWADWCNKTMQSAD